MKDTLENIRSNSHGNSLAMLHISVMLFGLSAVLGQSVDLPAVTIAGGRVVCSSLALLIFSLAAKSDLRLHGKKDYGIAIFTGGVLALHWTTFFLAIKSSSVAIGTITFSTFPLFLTFLEPLFFREKLRMTSLVSALFLLLGVWITVPSFSLESNSAIGMAWGLVSGLAYAVMSLSNRYLSVRYSGTTICIYEQGTAAVLLFPTLFQRANQWTTSNLLGVMAIGLVCTAVAHTLYVAALHSVKAQTAGIASGMETVYSVLFAFLFLGEVPSVRELAGGAVILGTAMFSTLFRNHKK